jgi:hypothetical protein
MFVLTVVETVQQLRFGQKERRLECLRMSYGKIQKLVRNIPQSKGRNAEVYVIDVTPTSEHPGELHTIEELIADQRQEFRTLLYDDCPEALQPMGRLLTSP